MTPINMEHGHSLVIPSHFDGNNYAYWKVRMTAFLKSIDERVWLSVENGWESQPLLLVNGLLPKKNGAFMILWSSHESERVAKLTSKIEKQYLLLEIVTMSLVCSRTCWT